MDEGSEEQNTCYFIQHYNKKKTYFYVYQIRILPCIQDSFPPAHRLCSSFAFGSLLSCSKPDPFHMRAIPFFPLVFPMDKCLPTHFRSCWNACPGSGVQQSWSVLRSSRWVSFVSLYILQAGQLDQTWWLAPQLCPVTLPPPLLAPLSTVYEIQGAQTFR